MSSRRPPSEHSKVLPSDSPVTSHVAGSRNDPSSGSKRSRISNACDRCRSKRIKCSGGLKCRNCIGERLPCVYGEDRRGRIKIDLAENMKVLASLREENRELVSAMRSVQSNSHFHVDDYPELIDLLSKYESENDNKRSQSPSGPQTESSITSESQKAGGEREAPATVGSPGAQGLLTKIVDLDHGIGAAGFIGKMSEISWMQRAREYLIHSPSLNIDTSVNMLDEHTAAALELSYFMDDEDLLSIDENSINPLELPPPELACILAEAMFHALQGGFQFVDRGRFLQGLAQFPRHKAVLSWAERRWLATANLVFALGAKWLQQTELEAEMLFPSHVEYYARARALGMDHRVVFDHPVLEQVQALGLLALYLLVNGSLARTWTILGQAIRHATSLGLHLKITDVTVSVNERDRRARTWYSLYCLEILLSEILGRPKSISTHDITAPTNFLDRGYLPSAYSEQIVSRHRAEAASSKLWQSFVENRRPATLGRLDGFTHPVPIPDVFTARQNSPQDHFLHRVRLCLISQRVGSALFSAGEEQSWQDLQRKTISLEIELQQWHMGLPDHLTLEGTVDIQDDPRSKIELAMYYQSVQMILHRPCLCSMEGRIVDESAESKGFNQRCAKAGIEAAMSMLDIMPDISDAAEAYQLLPWWALLHYICQASAILVLELCLDSEHLPFETTRMVSYLKKAMSYLYCLATASSSAFKAWKIFRQLLSDVTVRYAETDISDPQKNARKPLGWVQWEPINDTAWADTLASASPFHNTTEYFPDIYMGEAP